MTVLAHTGFTVRDLDRALGFYRDVLGIREILGGPESTNYWAYFRDPDGNVFEITERIS